MQRRSFTSMFLALPLFSSLFALAAKVPETVQELEDWFEQNFHCIDGPPRAYFEHPDFGRVTYCTFALSSFAAEGEKKIVQALYHSFLAAKKVDHLNGALLIWRSHPELEEEYEVSPVQPRWQPPDDKVPGWKTGCRRVSFRLAIPQMQTKVKYLKPEGALAELV